MTLEAWVSPTAVSGWRDVIYKGPDDIYFLDGSSSVGGPRWGAPLPPRFMGSSALPANVWSHLAATFDGSTLRIYVNGAEVASRPVFAQIATSTGALTIGGDAFYGQHFAAVIDEVRIYNTALGPTQIQTDMNTPIGDPGPPDTAAPTDPAGWRRPPCRRARSTSPGRARRTTSQWRTIGSSAVRVRPVRTSSRSRPRPAPPSTTPGSGGDDLPLPRAGR